MLTEIDLAYWVLLTREIGMVQTVSKEFFLQRLMMAALLAKKLTTDVEYIRIFEVFLMHNYPKLMESYYYWEENTSI